MQQTVQCDTAQCVTRQLEGRYSTIQYRSINSRGSDPGEQCGTGHLHNTTHYSTVQYCTAENVAAQNSAVQYNTGTVQYSIVQYCANGRNNTVQPGIAVRCIIVGIGGGKGGNGTTETPFPLQYSARNFSTLHHTAQDSSTAMHPAPNPTRFLKAWDSSDIGIGR